MNSSIHLCANLLALVCFASCSTSAPIVGARTDLPPIATWDGGAKSADRARTLARTSTGGMVVADDAIAAEWGAEILARGGNAVDAAVATIFAMSVTRPHYAALGGGGFLVYCPPSNGKRSKCETLDFREKAPAASTRDMYIRDGKANTQLSQNGALASGVPGLPAGLLHALEHYGNKRRQELLKRPIELAQSGIRISTGTERAAYDRWEHFNDEAKRIWGCGKNLPCPAGAKVVQFDLARVLEEISKKGRAGFYEGWVAQKLVSGIRTAGGILSESDLKNYLPSPRAPLTSSYRGHEVVTMGPPSSGGALLLQLLKYAELATSTGELDEGPGSARTIHALAHALQLAFADRAEVFGDPEFIDVPLDELLSQEYVAKRWATYSRTSAVKVSGPGVRVEKKPQITLREGDHTTHVSVVDRNGGAVAMTVTVNDNFGSGFVPPGTGVVMNNEMDDFSISPGVPNLFGLVGAEANSIHPGKRPLSSMTPTVVRDLGTGQVRFVLGAAGGPRIITSTFLTLVNRLEFGLSIQDAAASPRFHHQWRPAKLRLERNGFSAETRRALVSLGHEIDLADRIATLHGLERFAGGRVWGAPDPRGEGFAAAEPIKQ